MSSAELNDWTAYEQLYGPVLIQDRLDGGLLALQRLITHLWSGGTQKRTLRDFLPYWLRPARPKQTPEILQAHMESLARATEQGAFRRPR